MIHPSLRTALFAAMALAGLLAFQAQAVESTVTDSSGSTTEVSEADDSVQDGTETTEDVGRITPAKPASLSTELAKASLAQQGIDSPTQEQVDARAADVQAMRASGMGWGAIANSMGVRLGSVVSSLNRSKRATDVQEAKAVKTATKTKSKSKHKHADNDSESDDGSLTDVASGETDGTTPATASAPTSRFSFSLGFLGKGKGKAGDTSGETQTVSQSSKSTGKGSSASGNGNKGGNGGKGGGNAGGSNAGGGNKGGNSGGASGGGRGNGGNKGGNGGGNKGGNGGGKGKR